MAVNTRNARVRHLIIVLGDQLDVDSPAFSDFDNAHDSVWMAENAEEATHVWSHKRRLVFFFAAMRHFRQACEAAGRRVDYHALSANPGADRGGNFAELLRQDVPHLRPEKIILVEPGDYRVWQSLQSVAAELNVPLEVRPDTHFYCSIDEFRQWAGKRRQLRLENFYRELRQRHDILLTADGEPEGGQWNFDKANRATFGKHGPGAIPPPRAFAPDEITQAVSALVAQRFADHPGSLDDFAMPVTRADALSFLDDFIAHRLAQFGTYEDAMWSDQPVLYHSRLSALLNVKLLHPRECIAQALAAYADETAPLNSVEGFIRQILGWREYVRGVYWRHMPEYLDLNALECDDRSVPAAFWTGETDMNCVRQAMQSVLRHGYAHHIQRLMVLGLYAQLLGVQPRRFHEWHMAMYLDAIDWVSLPNALGMSQYGDGGIMGSKPYCASGQYINRMSDYCRHCRFDPKQTTGKDACPLTTLYWDFLARHAQRLRANTRMNLQLRNLDKKSDTELTAIRQQARQWLEAPL